MPARSPRASRKALPRQMPTSSTVWWRSTSRSPCASMVRSIRPCLDHASSMWSKKGIPVTTLEAPVPSRPRWSATCVSLVFRSIRPWRPPLLMAAVMASPPCDAHRCRCPVAVEPLDSGEGGQVRARLAEPRQRVLDHAQTLHEVFRAEGGGETGGAAGGEHVVGPGHVVAYHLGRVAAEEHRARVAHAREQHLGLGHLELEMLRSEKVDDLHRLLQAPGEDERPVRAKSGARDLAPRKPGELLLHGGRHRVDEGV